MVFFLQMKQSEKTNSKNEETATNTFIVLIFRQLLNLRENTSSAEIVKKSIDIIRLMTRYVHAVKTEFRQFRRPLHGIGAIHFGYR